MILIDFQTTVEVKHKKSGLNSRSPCIKRNRPLIKRITLSQKTLAMLRRRD